MKRHMAMVAMGFLIVGVLLLSTVTFTVNELSDIVLVKTFGKTTAVYQGAKDAGIHFKWIFPIQSVARYDSRTDLFEETYQETNTKDKHTVIVTAFCSWQIENPQLFDKVFSLDARSADEVMEKARSRLGTLMKARANEVIAAHPMEDLVNINADPQRPSLQRVEEEILQAFRRQVPAEYGVRILSVGIKNLGLPESVSKQVISAMNAERDARIKDIQSRGQSNALAIRARADAAKAKVLAFAEEKASSIRGEGDRAASSYYHMFNANPRLATFLRSLDSLKKELEKRSVILLDESVLPAIRFFHEGPSTAPLGPPGTIAAPAPLPAAPRETTEPHK